MSYSILDLRSCKKLIQSIFYSNVVQTTEFSFCEINLNNVDQFIDGLFSIKLLSVIHILSSFKEAQVHAIETFSYCEHWVYFILGMR